MSKYFKLLGEAPVDADFESFSSTLAQSIDKAPGDAYLIGSIAKQMGVSKQVVVNYISSSLYKNVFTDGRNEASTEDEYRQAISNALIQVVADLEKQHNIKIKNANSSVRGYTSRIISSLAQSTKDFSQPVNGQKVQQAVQAVAATEPEVKAQPQTEAPREEVKVREHNLGEEVTLAEQYFEQLEESIDKINKRSARYGLPPVTINKIGEEYKETKNSKIMYKNIKFTIDIPTLKLPGGWDFIASIDHMGEGNIINVSPEVELGQSLHDKYGTAKASFCDHCGKVRNRTTTYLVRNSDGQIKRVGKQCLRDYLPGGESSAEKILQLTKLWSDIFAGIRKLEAEQSSGEDYDGDGGGRGGMRKYASLKDMVNRAIAYIYTYGFTKSANRNDEYSMDPYSSAPLPTSTRIKDSFNPPREKPTEQELMAMGKIMELEKNPSETEEAIKWIQNYIDKQLEGNTQMRDYFSNLKVMFSNPGGAVKIKYAGYIASAVNTYFKNKTGQAEVAERKEGEFVGIAGMPIGQLKPLDRTKLKKQGVDITKPPYDGPINMTALTDTVAYERGSYSYYDSGVSYRSSLVDDDGNVYTLFSSSDYGFKKGEKTKLIRGIIKKHNEYTPRNSDKPIKQNLLTRADFSKSESEQVNEDDCTTFTSLLSRLNLLHS